MELFSSSVRPPYSYTSMDTSLVLLSPLHMALMIGHGLFNWLFHVLSLSSSGISTLHIRSIGIIGII